MISDHMTYIAYLRKLIATAKESKNPADISEFTRFDKTYLPILFDSYTTYEDGDEEEQRQATLDVIKIYLTVARSELPQQLFEHALEKFKSPTEPRKKRFLDLIVVLIPYQSSENIKRLYLQCIKVLPEIKGTKQKRAYRLLEEMSKSHADVCKEFLRKNRKSVNKILRKSLGSTPVACMGPRLRCLNYVMKSQPQLEYENKIIRSATTEAVICCKDMNESCTAAAYELLNTIGEILQKHGQIQQFVAIIHAGFGGPPQLISSTILALAFICHNFTRALGRDNIQAILENVLNLLSVPSREIVDSCLSFVNVFSTSTPNSVAAALQVIIESFCGMTEDCKRQFRLKIHYLLERFISIYGYDSIIQHVPISDKVMRKCLHRLRKLHSSNKRKENQENEKPEEELLRESIEEIVVVSDVDEKEKNKYNKLATIRRSSDNYTLGSEKTGTLHDRKRKRSASSLVSGNPSDSSSKYKPGDSDIHRPVEISGSSARNEDVPANKTKKAKYDIKKLKSPADLSLQTTSLNERNLISSNETLPYSHKNCSNTGKHRLLKVNNENLKIKFAQTVAGKETDAYHNLLNFLSGEEKLENLQRNGINPTAISGILGRMGDKAVVAFKDLYTLWFDEHGNKTKYLKTLEQHGIKLSNMSSMLHGASDNSARAFKELYDMWFEENGNKTQYLVNLEKEGINPSNISSILSGAKDNAALAFKDLYNVWFDAFGNKTQYLKSLQTEGINVVNMSSILSGAGPKAPEAFKDLYDVWFDAFGNKTQYLKTLEQEGIKLGNVTSILHGAKENAARAFKDLYDVWFDAYGNKTQYLKTLEEQGVSLSRMSSILSTAATNAPKAFKDLYDIWFDVYGNKTIYLKTLEYEGVNLCSVSCILCGAGANAANSFKDLYCIWFDGHGNKTQYLKTIEKEGVNLSSMSCMLAGAGANAANAFKDLYNVWFEAQGNKTKYLKTLEKEGVKLSYVTNILHAKRKNAAQAFKDLYNLWFDANGNKTIYFKTTGKV